MRQYGGNALVLNVKYKYNMFKYKTASLSCRPIDNNLQLYDNILCFFYLMLFF